MALRKAVRSRQFLRIAIAAPPGAGKTFTALRVAHAMSDSIAVIDSEQGSSELYAGEENPDGGSFSFDVDDLAGNYSVDNYIRALNGCKRAGIKLVVIDSLSHAWAGPGGILEFVDLVAEKSKSNNKYNAWAKGTPEHNRLLQAILTYPGHVIATMRSKMAHVQEVVNGKTVIRKVGLQAIQREGIEFEFTIVGDMDVDTHAMSITKSRVSRLADKVITKPGAAFAHELMDWLKEAPLVDRPGDGDGAPPPGNVELASDATAGRDDGADPVPGAEPPGDVTATEASIPFDQVRPLPAFDKPATPTGWSEAQRKRFFARLSDVGSFKYAEIADFMVHIGKPRPSEMTEEQRDGVLKWMATPAGLDRYAKYLESR
jgi:hypothetical protein